MSNPFDAMASRMDEATVRIMGKTATIDGEDYNVVESRFIAEMGALTGDGLSLVVFGDCDAKKGANVMYDGQSYIVTRRKAFNGKPQLWIE